MPTKRFSIARRFLTLWLALTLAWPNSALALRPRAGGLEERTATTQDLAQQLAPPPRTAGLEERPNVNRADAAVIEKALAALNFLQGRAQRQNRRALAEAIVATRPQWLGYLNADHFLAQMKGAWPLALEPVQQQAVAAAFSYGMTRRRFGMAVALGVGAAGVTMESQREKQTAGQMGRIHARFTAHDRLGEQAILAWLQRYQGRRIPVVFVGEAGPPRLQAITATSPAFARQITVETVEFLIQQVEQGAMAEVERHPVGRGLINILKAISAKVFYDLLAQARANPQQFSPADLTRWFGDREPMSRYLMGHPEITVLMESCPLLAALYGLRQELAIHQIYRSILDEGLTEAHDRAISIFLQYNALGRETRDRTLASDLVALLKDARYAGAEVQVARGTKHYRLADYIEALGLRGFTIDAIRSAALPPLEAMAEQHYQACLTRPWQLPVTMRRTAHRYAFWKALESVFSKVTTMGTVEITHDATQVMDSLSDQELQQLVQDIQRHRVRIDAASKGSFESQLGWFARYLVAWLNDRQKIPADIHAKLPAAYRTLTRSQVEESLRQARPAAPGAAIESAPPAGRLVFRDGPGPWRYLSDTFDASLEPLLATAGLEERTAVTQDLTQQLAPVSRASGLEEIPQPTADELAGWLSMAPMSEAAWRLYGPLVALPPAERGEIAETVAKAYRVFGRHFQRTARYLVRTRGQGVEDTKPDGSPVLPQDKTVQRRFNRLAPLTIPGIAVIGEEGSVLNPTARWWVTRDPLDGTRNYRPPMPGEQPTAYPSHYLSTMTLCYRLDDGRMVPVLTIAVAPEYLNGAPLWLVAGLGIDGVLVNGQTVQSTANLPLRELVAGVGHLSESVTVNEWYLPALQRYARRVVEYPDAMAMFEIPLSVNAVEQPATLAVGEGPLWDNLPTWHLTEALGGAVLELASGRRFQPTLALLAPGQTATTPALVYAVSHQAARDIVALRPAGLEEPTEPGDPTLRQGSGQAVPMPDPSTTTAAGVADYLTRRWGIPVRQEGSRYVVDQWTIPPASWTMPAMHDPVPGRIIEDVAAMPVQVPTYRFGVLPTFSVPPTSARGAYLGFIKGVDHPVVIKITSEVGRWWPGDLDEVVDAQIFEHQGSGPDVDGVIQQANGDRGYTMQVVPGRSPQSSKEVVLAHPDTQALIRRAGEAGLSLPSVVHTVIDRYVGMDAGNARTIDADRRTAWIIAQNAGWAIHELWVKAITIVVGKAYVLSNQAALAVLALLKLPPGAPLPVVAVVTPAQRERLRAMARQGGFSDAAITVWEQRYLVIAASNDRAGMQAAMLNAIARLAARLGRPDIQPIPVYDLPKAPGAFRDELLKLLSEFGLTIEPETLPDEAIQDLYRAAQA